MKKTNFLLLSLKKQILPTLFCLFTLSLLLFSRSNLVAAKNGILLWANAVLPSLLPFFIATELLSHTNIIPALGKLLNPIMRPLFHVPGEGAFAVCMGIISGTPVGAKVVTDFRNQGIVTKEEGERLLAFTNNSGPLFILGTVGITLLGNAKLGYLLLATHLLACLSVGLLFRFWKYSASSPKAVSQEGRFCLGHKKAVTFSTLGEILGDSIHNSIHTVVMVGGFVVIFSVLLSILKQSHILQFLSTMLNPLFTFLGFETNFCVPILTGILELTNGVSQVCEIASKSMTTILTLCAFLLGFGGISIGLQVFSITSNSDLSIKPYFIGKFLQGILASIYTFLLVKNIPLLNLDLEPVFSNSASKLNFLSSPTIFSPITLLLLIGMVLWLFYKLWNTFLKKKQIV